MTAQPKTAIEEINAARDALALIGEGVARDLMDTIAREQILAQVRASNDALERARNIIDHTQCNIAAEVRKL